MSVDVYIHGEVEGKRVEGYVDLHIWIYIHTHIYMEYIYMDLYYLYTL